MEGRGVGQELLLVGARVRGKAGAGARVRHGVVEHRVKRLDPLGVRVRVRVRVKVGVRLSRGAPS